MPTSTPAELTRSDKVERYVHRAALEYVVSSIAHGLYSDKGRDRLLAEGDDIEEFASSISHGLWRELWPGERLEAAMDGADPEFELAGARSMIRAANLCSRLAAHSDYLRLEAERFLDLATREAGNAHDLAFGNGRDEEDGDDA